MLIITITIIYETPKSIITLLLSVEWTLITVKLLFFVRDLDYEKATFSGGKYPFKYANMDEINILQAQLRAAADRLFYKSTSGVKWRDIMHYKQCFFVTN